MSLRRREFIAALGGAAVWGCCRVGRAVTTVGRHEPPFGAPFDALALVIDELLGTLCITYSAVSRFSNIDAAIENLRVREGMPTRKSVGFISPSGKQSATAMERHPEAVKSISAWINTSGFDAAIWTALGSNFEERTGESFSVKAAIRYLEARNSKSLDTALEYIRRAPPEVKTPVRDAVNIRWSARTQAQLPATTWKICCSRLD